MAAPPCSASSAAVPSTEATTISAGVPPVAGRSSRSADENRESTSREPPHSRYQKPRRPTTSAPRRARGGRQGPPPRVHGEGRPDRAAAPTRPGRAQAATGPTPVTRGPAPDHQRHVDGRAGEVVQGEIIEDVAHRELVALPGEPEADAE